MSKGQMSAVDLFRGLQKLGAQTQPSNILEPQKAISREYKKHTFNIKESIWSDFVVLARIMDRQFNELINEVLASTIEDYREIIEQMKAFKK